jgi:5-methylcytosine-specific restriction endonuclease McrA
MARKLKPIVFKERKMLKGTHKESCLWCGRAFVTKKQDKYYCSVRCLNKANPPNKTTYVQTCVNCGKKFIHNNPNALLCSEPCRKAHTKSNIPTGLSQRFLILSRDGFKCRYCGRGPDDGVKLMVDHIFPKSKGGSNNPSNLITACEECNLGKADMVITRRNNQIPWFMSVTLPTSNVEMASKN